MTNWTKILLIFLLIIIGLPTWGQIKTNVQTDIAEIDRAKRELEQLQSLGDSSRLSQVSDSLFQVIGDTLASLTPDSLLNLAKEQAIRTAEDSLRARYGDYEDDILQLRKEISDYSKQLSETNPDSLILNVARDSLEGRLAQHHEVQQMRHIFNKYKHVFKREDQERRQQIKQLKKERRTYRKAERRATREDSLLAIRIHLNEIQVAMTALEHDQDSSDALVHMLKKEFLDSAEVAGLAQEFAPKEFTAAQQELADMSASAADPQTLLFGSQSGLPSVPASPDRIVPQKPPPLPKYNTLAKDLMDPKAFTEGKYKDKQHLLDEGHKKLSELKKKYAKLPDSENLKTAVKKNSLKEEPLRKRFFISGTNNLQITKSHVAVEFNGQLGYQFNKVWRAGFGGSLNTEWYAEKPYVRWKEGYPFSWNLFGQYTFFKSYIAHLEFEPVKSPAGGETPSEMRHKLLVGVGKIFAIPKLKNVDGVVLLLYDTTSGESFGNRFKVRFGVNVGL